MLKLIKKFKCFQNFEQNSRLYKNCSDQQCLLSKFNNPSSQLNSGTHFHTSTTVCARQPRLLYVQNPFRWMQNRFDLKLFKLAWDPTFAENEFKRGVAQAVSVLTNHLRTNNINTLKYLTTTDGFDQISRDMSVSRGDARLNLLRFRPNDIRKVIPIKVYFARRDQTKHCFIDTFTVAYRFLDEMTDLERVAIKKVLRQNKQYARLIDADESRVLILAEIIIRFHREYSLLAQPEWNVAYLKIASVNVMSVK